MDHMKALFSDIRWSKLKKALLGESCNSNLSSDNARKIDGAHNNDIHISLSISYGSKFNNKKPKRGKIKNIK